MYLLDSAAKLFKCRITIFADKKIRLFIVSLKKDKLYIHLLLGLSIAVAFLTRPEGMFLLLLPGLRLFGVFEGKIRFEKEYFLKLVLITLVFVLSISPYMLFLKKNTGKFSVSGKANVSIILGELSSDMKYHDVVNAPDNLYDRAAFALNDDKTELRGWNKKDNLSLKEYILKDPAAFSRKYRNNIMRQIYTLIKLLLPILLPLFFVFCIRGVFKERVRLIFIGYPCFFFLMYPCFIIIEKQTLSIVLYLIFFSSGGFAAAPSVISGIAGKLGIEKSRAVNLLEKAIKPVIVLLLVVSSLVYLKFTSFDKVPHSYEHERAGLYLKEHASAGYEDINVMARKPYTNYYSDARFTMMPYAGIEDVINFAKLYKVDYIVVDERSLSRWDHYDELLELQTYSDQIEVFYQEDAGALIRVFKLVR